MKMSRLCIGRVAILSGSMLHAQNIVGNWQGTLKAGPSELRVVIAIDKSADGKWNGTLRSIDQSPDWGVGTPIDRSAGPEPEIWGIQRQELR